MSGKFHGLRYVPRSPIKRGLSALPVLPVRRRFLYCVTHYRWTFPKELFLFSFPELSADGRVFSFLGWWLRNRKLPDKSLLVPVWSCRWLQFQPQHWWNHRGRCRARPPEWQSVMLAICSWAWSSGSFKNSWNYCLACGNSIHPSIAVLAVCVSKVYSIVAMLRSKSTDITQKTQIQLYFRITPLPHSLAAPTFLFNLAQD